MQAEPPPALFRAGLVDPVRLLPAPAALDTEEMRAELQTVLRVQESRTDKEVKRARADEKIRTDSFQTALGPWLTANNLPRLQALFERMEKEAKVYSDIAKNHFKRPRPLVADARVKPLFEMSDPGYPSGHALRGQMFALVLSELAPDKAETLLARGREIGWSRVVGGVHFPSDVSAGRTLGQALAREMLANPAIRTELAEIHREFDAARQQGPGPEPCIRRSHRSKFLKKVRLSAGYKGTSGIPDDPDPIVFPDIKRLNSGGVAKSKSSVVHGTLLGRSCNAVWWRLSQAMMRFHSARRVISSQVIGGDSENRNGIRAGPTCPKVDLHHRIKERLCQTQKASGAFSPV